jgi:hypothetical protein
MWREAQPGPTRIYDLTALSIDANLLQALSLQLVPRAPSWKGSGKSGSCAVDLQSWEVLVAAN